MTSRNDKEIDWRKVGFGAISVGVAAVIAYYGQPYIHNNSVAINILVTVFSVLAGFLVAIIAIVGDPILLPPGTWRAAEIERPKMINRLKRHRLLFVLYLVTLAVTFASLLIGKYNPMLGLWLERAILFLGSFAFLMSLFLPSALMQAQLERIDMVIEHRRGDSGLDNK